MTLIPTLKQEAMITENSNVQDTTFRHGPGRQLQTAREALRKSVEEIANQLHLTKTMVLAIEQDRYEHMHVPFTFIRGYLRAYARVVHLSSDMIVKAFDQMGLVEQRNAARLAASPLTQHQPRGKGIDIKWIVYSGVAAVVLAVGGFWFWSKVSAPDPMRQDLIKLLNNIDKDVSQSSISPIKDAPAYGYNDGAVAVDEQFQTNDSADAPVQGNIPTSESGQALQDVPMPNLNVNNIVNTEAGGQNTPQQPYLFGPPTSQALRER